jgi:hypothetical protein
MNAKHGGLLALCFGAFASACGPVEDDQNEMGSAATEGLVAVDEAAVPPGATWTWTHVLGAGSDVAVDTTFGGGAWVIGTIAYGGSGNYRVYRYNPYRDNADKNPWDPSNIGGRRISVGADGHPWVVGAGGEIWNLFSVKQFGSTDSATGEWVRQPGCATDIAAGPDTTTAWYLGCQANSAGNYAIYQVTFTGTTTSNGAGVRIAVSDTGVPWVVSAAGYVYQRTSTSATSGTWQMRSSGGKASDISVSADDDVWIIAKTPVGDRHGFDIQYRNGSTWTSIGGLGTNIATWYGTRPEGHVWLVNNQDNVYDGHWVGF